MAYNDPYKKGKTMRYINWLAHQQMVRFAKFKYDNLDLSELDARLQFFGQPYEIHMSFIIANAVDQIMPIDPPLPLIK